MGKNFLEVVGVLTVELIKNDLISESCLFDFVYKEVTMAIGPAKNKLISKKK